MVRHAVCFFSFFLWLLLPPASLMALTPLPLKWHTLLSEGSTVILNGETKASFRIRPGEEGPNMGGYGYLLSDPIPLPSNWDKVTIYGKWWQSPSSKDDCEKVTLLVQIREPDQHIQADTSKGGYIEISHDNWQETIQFADKGTKLDDYEAYETPRDVPLQPTPFKIEITKDGETGWLGWRFHEKTNGIWEELFSCKKAIFFQDIHNLKLIWKIGGTASSEGNSLCNIHFSRLGYQISQTQLEDSRLQEDTLDQDQRGQEKRSKRAKATISCDKAATSLDYRTLLPYADGVTIPISGGCRGACGGGCPDQCQAMPNRAIVINGSDGGCYYLVYYKQVKRCGSHVGCRYHDSCFDYCKEVQKETGPLKELKPCHDYCSGVVVEVFGARIGKSWMLGDGPYDDRLVFFDSNRDNPKVMGPFDPSSLPIEALKARGIIAPDTQILMSSDLPPTPQKELYAIEVWTGDMAGAGTDSPIGITLFDTTGHNSGELVLPPSPFPVVPKMPSEILSSFTNNLDGMGSLAQLGHNGLEKGSHETYYFLLGNHVGKISYIRLRRLHSKPKWWQVGQRLQGTLSALSQKAKEEANKAVGALKRAGTVIPNNKLTKQIGTDILHKTVGLVKGYKDRSLGNRNNTNWYCKRVRIFQEKWNSFTLIKLLGDFYIDSWITQTGKYFPSETLKTNTDDFLIYTYDNLGKRLLAITPSTGKAKAISHGIIPVTVGDLSPGPTQDTLFSLGLRVPNVNIFVLHTKSNQVNRLDTTDLKFGEAVEYDPVNGVIVGSGRDKIPGTYNSYLFLRFDKKSGTLLTATTTNIGDMDSIARDPFSGRFYAIDNQPGVAVNLWQLNPDTGRGVLVKRWDNSELFGFDGMIGIAFVAPNIACGLLHKGGHVPMKEYRLVHINMKDFSMSLLPERNLGLKAGLHLSAPTALPVGH